MVVCSSLFACKKEAVTTRALEGEGSTFSNDADSGSIAYHGLDVSYSDLLVINDPTTNMVDLLNPNTNETLYADANGTNNGGVDC